MERLNLPNIKPQNPCKEFCGLRTASCGGCHEEASYRANLSNNSPKKIDILSFTLAELTESFEDNGFLKFRAKQVFDWLHDKKVGDFSLMTNLAKDLQENLSEYYVITNLDVRRHLESQKGDTTKFLFGLSDNNTIEAVLMRHNHGNSLCISSQVGCKMGCRFCASGMNGLVRNLTASEMLAQVYASEKATNKKVNSIVIMGIGEPLDNFENLLVFLERLQSSYKMSLRHVSLSTCGICDKIDELAKLNLGLTLSISLHAVDDDCRSEIMPVNRKFGISRLLQSCREYFKATGRRISFEYALIAGVNDSADDAKKLTALLTNKETGMPRGSFHVNLIPVNEIGVTEYIKSGNAEKFRKALERRRVNATIRRTMGSDIEAACGQLRQRDIELK
ncbi:MAG: 23S rRNA (adenine(2503)-C(2))-methyltransferase RlmN [Oscillospiraceae bacterium]|nr:23S rRNA (adenine(2503)-C(2))-methyltransferase RlmN [Oscillospiraceae bacterium]